MGHTVVAHTGDGAIRNMSNVTGNTCAAMKRAVMDVAGKRAHVPSSYLEYVVVPFARYEPPEDIFEHLDVTAPPVGGVRLGWTEESDDDADEIVTAVSVSSECGLVELNLSQELNATGGRIWDSSIIMAAWLAEGGRGKVPFPSVAGTRTKLLELGSGLGVLGLTASKLFGSRGVSVVISDYDLEVLDRVRLNIQLNCSTMAVADKPALAMIDFRDFAVGSTCNLAERYANHLGGYDCIIAADIVYQHSHTTLGRAVDALLRPDDITDLRPTPCALILLPDSRGCLSTFVENARSKEGGNMDVTCMPVRQDCALLQRLRKSRKGLGSRNSFSLYVLTRR